MRSPAVSIPTERRMRPSVMPSRALLGGERDVRRRRGVQRHRPHVADVRHPADHAERVEEALRAAAPAADGEREHGARASAEALLCDPVIRAVRESGVVDALHGGMPRQPPRDLLRVGEVPIHPQRQRLHALLEEEGMHRRQRRTEVVDDAEAEEGFERPLAVLLQEGRRTRRGRAGDPRIGAVRSCPVERAAVDDRAGEGGAVTGEELRRRVHDDVRAEFERPDHVWRRHRVVDDERDAVGAGDLRDRHDVDQVVLRVRDRLDEDRLRLRCDEPVPLRVIARNAHVVHGDTEPRERAVEEGPCSAVDAGGGDDALAAAGEAQQQAGDRSLTRSDDDRARAALERREPPLGHLVGGVEIP